MARFRYQRGEQPLEGFTVEHGLGVGGFGEVYFAVSDSGREVAIKAVQNYQEIELRGIRNCMNLKSPHLVTIFDVKHNDRGDPFVIMEYVHGPCLHRLLENEPNGLGETKAAFFLREIAKGLSYLHDHGVVHRDLKPHNVFYEEGYVKIGDYSLCKLISSTQHSGHTMTVGSVHYMAPEISKGQYDLRVDIYALGIMLYEMLTGAPPFVGQSIGEVLMKHLNEEPDLSSVNEPFRSVVQQAIAKDPDERFASAGEMVAAIYGHQNVEDSAVAFNPQELTLVAAKVAAEAPGISRDGGDGFKSGDASAWKDGGDPVPLLTPIEPSSASLADTDTSKKTVVEPARQGAVLPAVREPIHDPMPWLLRWGLAAAGTFAMAVSVNQGLGNILAETGLPGRDEFGAWVFCLIAMSTIVFGVFRHEMVHRLPPSKIVRHLLAVWVLLLIGPALLQASFHVVGRSSLFGLESAIGISYAGLLACCCLNVIGMTDPKRDQRFSFKPVVYAGALAIGLSWFFSQIVSAGPPWPTPNLYMVPITIAAGIAIVLQITSPKASKLPTTNGGVA